MKYNLKTNFMLNVRILGTVESPKSFSNLVSVCKAARLMQGLVLLQTTICVMISSVKRGRLGLSSVTATAGRAGKELAC
jgi:hypothetical protein